MNCRYDKYFPISLSLLQSVFISSQDITNDLITDILENGLYQTIKAILEEQGIEAGFCRQPMKEATPEMRAKAKVMYEKYFQNQESLLNA